MLADLDTLVARAGALSLPGMGAGMPRLGGQDRAAAAAAMKTMTISLYTGADDRILRRLVVNGAVENHPVALDVTFTDVGKDQTIAAPADAKPFSELLKLFDAAGFGGLEKALPNQLVGQRAEQRGPLRRVHRAGGRRPRQGAQVRRVVERLTLTRLSSLVGRMLPQR